MSTNLVLFPSLPVMLSPSPPSASALPHSVSLSTAVPPVLQPELLQETTTSAPITQSLFPDVEAESPDPVVFSVAAEYS